MAKFISVVSGKGGTGKSTVSASLALSLAALGFSVLSVDLDFGLRSLDLLLGVEDRVIFDMGDVLEGRCRLDKAMVAHTGYPRLKLLCAPTASGADYSTSSLSALLSGAAEGCDYCILDLPAGLGISVELARELSDLVAVVTVPDRITMRDTRKTVDALLSESTKPCRLIINKVGRESMISGGLSDLDELLDTVGIQLFGVVPWDPYINVLPVARVSALSAPNSRQQTDFGGNSQGDFAGSSQRAFGGKPSGRSGKAKRGLLTQRVFDAMAERVTGKYVPILVKSV